jgi:predicted HTH transcriptional regulator
LVPELAIRELVANAIIHQDFSLTGTGPMVEIFEHRVDKKLFYFYVGRI